MDQPDEAMYTIEAQVAMLLRLSECARRSAVVRGELDRSAYLVLGVLAAGPVGIHAIADALRLDPSTVTRQVVALEQVGHVARTGDPADGRITLVDLTPAGLAALAATRDVRAQLYGEILDAWTPQDRAVLAGLLTRLNADVDTWARAHAGR